MPGASGTIPGPEGFIADLMRLLGQEPPVGPATQQIRAEIPIGSMAAATEGANIPTVIREFLRGDPEALTHPLLQTVLGLGTRAAKGFNETLEGGPVSMDEFEAAISRLLGRGNGPQR